MFSCLCNNRYGKSPANLPGTGTEKAFLFAFSAILTRYIYGKGRSNNGTNAFMLLQFGIQDYFSRVQPQQPTWMTFHFHLKISILKCSKLSIQKIISNNIIFVKRHDQGPIILYFINSILFHYQMKKKSQRALPNSNYLQTYAVKNQVQVVNLLSPLVAS